MTMPPREPFVCKRFIKNYRFAKGDRRDGQFAYVADFPRNPPVPGKTKNPGLFEQDTGLHTRFDMKNHTATTAERAGKLNAQPSLARFDNAKVATRFRRVLRESFAMAWPDFIGAVLGMICGAKRQHSGIWSFGGIRVCERDLNVGAEAGWCRWNLPGTDGLVRNTPWGAPSVMRSPSGALFLLPPNGDTPRRIWSFGELVRIAGHCRSSGWRAA
ncbi:hypothetical protein ACI2UG_04425 [Ralstonia nicotianae]